MPLINPKGGPTPLGADTTAGHRGLPGRPGPDGGTARFPSDGLPRPPLSPPSLSLLSTDVRGGNTDGVMYEVPLRRRTPASGDGTGQ